MKHKNKLQIGLLFTSMLILIPCNANVINNATTQSSAPQQQVDDKGLTGQWIASCLPSKELPGYHYISVNNFSTDDAFVYDSIETYFYRDATGGSTCEDKSKGFSSILDTTVFFNFDEASNKGSNDEHTNIDFVLDNVALEVFDDYHKDLFNNGGGLGNNNKYSGYGIKDWIIGEKKYLNDIPAAYENFKIGTNIPDIFNISTRNITSVMKKIIQFGDPTNEDADNRPISLSKNYAVKQ